jgi:DNA-binding CsgD family transcriptional regulator
MRHVLGMDWLGGYPTACHRVMFAASNSMNLRCSLASDFGVSQLGLAGHRLFRHEAVMRSAMKLVGRRSECGMLDRLVEAVCAGQSRALVLCGEPGVGKTALLQHLVARAASCRVMQTAGVESEMELAFAGLHQMCAPLLAGLDYLPERQSDALRIALGVSSGLAPDRFLVGLATLGLLAHAAEQGPVVCVVDDEQWLDRASAQVLGFVARRLAAESVGLVFAARAPTADLAGLSQLPVQGLGAADARTLLDAELTVPLDGWVRDQLVAETRGNPLALLEWPRALTTQQWTGGFGLPGAVRLPGGVAEGFRHRLDLLPEPTRRLLLIAAADPLGDAGLVWRAAARLGIDGEAAVPAVEDGLVEFGTRVLFRHPLVRSVVYTSALVRERRQVHGALAQVTDVRLDPDRHAWHGAQAAAGPDEDVAAELEGSAGRAQARGGLAAAAAFLERAAALTVHPEKRVERALSAASAQVQAGGFDIAQDLLSLAKGLAPSAFQQARIEMLEAELAFATARGGDAPQLLLKAAQRLESIDAGLARATYLQAVTAAIFTDALIRGDVGQLAEAAAAAPPPTGTPSATDLLLDGVAAHYTQGYAAGAPILRAALDQLSRSPENDLRGHLLASMLAYQHLWDHGRWQHLSDRYLELARSLGALSELPSALMSKVCCLAYAGELSAAAALNHELEAVIEATGVRIGPYAAMTVAAMRGRPGEVADLIDAARTDLIQRRESFGITTAHFTSAMANNAVGNYQAAMRSATESELFSAPILPPPLADSPTGHRQLPSLLARLSVGAAFTVEVVEAAARCGHTDLAADAVGKLAEVTSGSGTDWACGLEARCRALLADGTDAEDLYRESIERLGRTTLRPDLARTHLVYGEWLRRERRRGEARAELRRAHHMFEEMGMEGFAGRAHRELEATGETARKRTIAPDPQMLTAQEAQIARLARDGHSNPEIGARLFISTRTVEYHLQKVFTKLDVQSRRQLDRVLPD